MWFTQLHKRRVSGLHQDPADPGIRHHWLAMLRLSDRDLPPRAGVCHFSPECFSNLMEVNMGSCEVLMLKSKAVPSAAALVPTAGPTSAAAAASNCPTY